MHERFRPDLELAEQMAWLADQAVSLAAERMHIRLDYSDASIEAADAVAAHYHKVFRPRWFRARPQGEFNAVVLALGAYIGEVYRRNHGATWGRIDPNQGPLAATLHTEFDALVWPIARSRKCLENGSEDSFGSWFEGILAAGRDEFPGMTLGEED